MVATSLASIPPDALYTAASKHTSVSTLSSKPDHEYENLKIMPTPMATPNLCQVTRSNSSSSSSSSRQKRDELTVRVGATSEVKEGEVTTSDHGAQGDSNNSGYRKGEMQTFKRQENKQDETKVLPKSLKGPQYVPVYQPYAEHLLPYQDKLKTGTNNNRSPSSGVVYAELQLPRASNNGSMRRGDQRHPQNKTQYAEITFQGRPLQTADI
ncbi:hypothetical protein Hamer_G021845 [Homarus americanus]|uniref:Uncharacterized protein n=1 Tax=Homarus americanus TaxID=6706 RepID=A0A8J5JQW0_HOMAM|nr:hypothetical protein Hamer_G021845 [Homarus americanus]